MKNKSSNIRLMSGVKKRNGLTFVELFIVIIIIGVLSAAAIPNFRKTYNSFQLDSFVKNIYYLAKYLQASAVSSNKIYRLDIGQKNGSVELQAMYKKSEEGFLNVEGRFSKAYKAPEDITIAVIDPPERTSIFFYPDATIDSTAITFRNRFKKESSLVIKSSNISIK